MIGGGLKTPLPLTGYIPAHTHAHIHILIYTHVCILIITREQYWQNVYCWNMYSPTTEQD